MTSLSYIAESLPWIIFGLLVGYLVGYLMGRATVAVESIADAVQEGDSVAEHAPSKPARRRFNATHVVGLVLVVLGVATAIQGYVQGQRTERLAICQQAYSNGFADALEARSNATTEAQDALDEFLSAAAGATPTQEGRDLVRRALDEYLSKRAAAKKAQAEHPFPDPPRDVC